MVYKILDTLLKNKADLVTVQPVLREFDRAGRLQAVRRARIIPARCRYFKEKNLQPAALG